MSGMHPGAMRTLASPDSNDPLVVRDCVALTLCRAGGPRQRRAARRKHKESAVGEWGEGGE